MDGGPVESTLVGKVNRFAHISGIVNFTIAVRSKGLGKK
jgi:hypothetical protein